MRANWNTIRRAVLHIPVGLLAGIGMEMYPLTAWAFVLSFLAYEWIEDWRIEDKSYKDLLGFLIGLAGVMVYGMIRG